MENNISSLYAVKIKKLPSSQVEISASIPREEFDALREKALKHIGGEIELPGFRKGHVPEKIIAQRVGESAILEEMAEMAISHAYPAILANEKIDALGRPEVRITKIAPGNPLEFTLVTAVFPEIVLPEYKKIAAKIGKKNEKIVVTDEDVTKTIDQIRRTRAQRTKQASGDTTVSEESKTEDLPPLDDDFVRTLGEFADLADFMVKLKENMLAEKTREARDKKRVSIIEAILSDTKIDLPNIITDQELHRMEDEFASEVERMGMTLDAYLKTVNKNKEDIRKEWRPDAEKRAKVQLVASKIAELEKISPDEVKLRAEVAALTERFPDADPERATSYVSMLLINDQVFSFLETAGEDVD